MNRLKTLSSRIRSFSLLCEQRLQPTLVQNDKSVSSSICGAIDNVKGFSGSSTRSHELIASLAHKKNGQKRFAFKSYAGSYPIYVENGVKIDVQPIPLVSPFAKKEKMTMLDRVVSVSGKLGSLKVSIPEGLLLRRKDGLENGQEILSIDVDEKFVSVLDDKKQKFVLNMWGTVNTLIRNAIVGVTEGHCVPLNLVGIGYRASVIEGDVLDLRIGVSHPILLKVPADLRVEVPFPTRILLHGIDLYRVSLFASKVRELQPPEPYKGKGIYVGNETITLKKKKQK